MEKSKNRFDLNELAGAFGDLGTLIPFVVAYISLLKMAPNGILLGFGLALMAVGLIYKTPFPVQPMKAIGAAALTQTAGAVTLSASMVVGAGLVTGLLWVLLGATGLAHRLARWIPPTVTGGIVLGLGFSFMLEGLRMMAQDAVVAVFFLGATLWLLGHSRVPAMVLLLVAGAILALLREPRLMAELGQIRPDFQLPALAWPTLSWNDLWLGAILLALPQLPLTFGNALISITAENNRLFPDRPVNERSVALSTGLLNLGSSLIGGIPMCHGAGGMAGHVKFGARTGGASLMLGMLLAVLGLFFSDSIATLFRLFPPAVLGIVLFLAGTELALGARPPGEARAERFIVLGTAAIAILNVGLAMVFGFALAWAVERGWLKL